MAKNLHLLKVLLQVSLLLLLLSQELSMLSKRQSSNLKKKKLPLSKKTVKKQPANALLANLICHSKKPLLQRFFVTSK